MSKLPVPTTQSIQLAFDDLIQSQRKKLTLTYSQWALYARWARFDPRLAELWVLAVKTNWRELAPVVFREENLKLPIPATVGLLLEHVSVLLSDETERVLFGLWKKVIQFEVPLATHENFFIGVREFASSGMVQDAEQSLKVYLKWGFLGRDMLVNKFSERQAAQPKTYLDASRRALILNRLLKTRRPFRIEDYIQACGGAVSRRVAQKDLENHPRVSARGHTRARVYCG